ncbi:MAG: large extracellular alpha-helical protein [Desulfamplus sp.]|nr:large extracellular alpha-helical protein [Desulfamplus sp.]
MKNLSLSNAVVFIISILTITITILTPLSFFISPFSTFLSLKTAHAENIPLTITRITPAGDGVDNERQIVIQFSRQVVPLGRMDRDADEIPITINPKLKGQWRWLNPTDLAFHVDAASKMKLATTYTITVKPGIMTQDNITLAEPIVHTFVTQRPAISYYQFITWKSPGVPVIALHFNQPVTKDSVLQQIFFSLANSSDSPEYKNPIRIENPKNREPITNSNRTNSSNDKSASNNNSFNEKEIKSSITWMVYPANELPLDSTVRLIANYGIVSEFGPEQSVERKDIVQFDTFPEVKFAGIRCYTIKDENSITISPEQSESGDLQHIVDPRGYTELLFTVPVSFEEIRDKVVFTPDLAQGQKDYDPWANAYSGSGLNYPHSKGTLYSVALPQYLKAWQKYTILEKSTKVKDMFGRPLVTSIDFTFSTDHRRAEYHILHETGVLEKDIDSEVPLAVTNIDEMTIKYNALTNNNQTNQNQTDQRSQSNQNEQLKTNANQNKTISTNSDKETPDIRKTVVKSNLRVQDVAYFTPLGVREMLNGNSGAVYGNIVSTSPSVDKNERETQFFTVVTPWQIHAKVGHFNTSVWVTSLVTGEPVSGVIVTVHRDLVENLTRNSPALAESITDQNGIAMLPGIVVLDPKRETFDNSWEYRRERLIIKATTNNVQTYKTSNVPAQNSDKAIQNSDKSSQSSDLALLPLTDSHDFSVPLWRISDGDISSQTEPKYAHIHVWGTTPQGIYKAGDTIDYKIYVRDQNNNSFTTPPLSGYKLTITDPAGKNVVEKKDVTLSEFGAFDGQYTVPENGVIGWYQFTLSASFSDRDWEPLKVLVTDFTPSPFKVSTELNGDYFKPEDTLNIETAATMHAGGQYSDAPVRVTVRLKEELFQPDNPVAKSFIFYRAAGGNENDFQAPVNENNQTPADANQPPDNGEEIEESEYPSDVPETLLEKTASLDHQGIIKNSIQLSNLPSDSNPLSSDSKQLSSGSDKPLPLSSIAYGRIEVESAVQDDRGRFVTNMKTAAYLGRKLFVGIKTTQWVYEAEKPAMIKAIVVDGNGNPINDVKIRVMIQHRVTKAARIKGAGNAYLTKYINEWVTTEEKTLRSTLDPLEFYFTPSAPGDYRILAIINQTSSPQSNIDKTASIINTDSHISSISTWVTGKGYVLWQAPDDFSLAIIPERDTYKVGDTAKYLVKNPFPGAYALISVERYGILRQWVERLENATQVVEIPVQSSDVPGFFLSVTVISPRAGDSLNEPPPPDGVDLGKPTFRLGYVKTKVKESEHDISIKVLPEKLTYKPGDTVRVKINAETGLKENQTQDNTQNKNKEHKITQEIPAIRNKEKIELAVVVLDESVFDLIVSGRDHFDIFKGFHTLDGLDVENYSLLTNMIGRRKFEKKGAKVGGDGGAGMKMRSSFKYVSYWNPSLVTDENGNADIEFTAPDNLTGWKIFVMAVTPTDRMGLGEGGFKVNRPTEIRPVMPNQVTAGDSFEAGFSVMNRTDKPRTLHVAIKIDSSNNEIKQDITLLPFKRQTVFIPVSSEATIATASSSGTITFTAQAQDDLDGDAVIHTLQVNKKISLITVMNYGMISQETIRKSINDQTINGRNQSSNTQQIITEKLLYPENIHTETGETKINLYPTVLGNMEEAFRYMSQYPYGCWEQKLSKAVMASHFMELKDYLPTRNGEFTDNEESAENASTSETGFFSWQEAPELPDKTLKQAVQFQAPNGGMAYFTPDDNYVCPYLSAYTALAFEWLKSRGIDVPQDVEDKLSGYLATLLRKDVFPSFENSGFIDTSYSTGMASTVRAVSLAALARGGKINLSDIIRYENHVKEMSLFGKAHFLMAAMQVKGAEQIVQKVWEMILSSCHYSAGKVVFSETLDSGFSRILESSTRTQGAILSVIVQYGRIAATNGSQREKVKNASPKEVKKNRAEEARELAFKLVRTITANRGRDNSGENTQENIFCMNGLADYSAQYERFEGRAGQKYDKNGKEIKQIRAGEQGNNIIKANVTLKHESRGIQTMGTATFRSLKDAPVKFARQIISSDPGKKADIIITRDSSADNSDANIGKNASVYSQNNENNSISRGTIYYSAGISYAPKDDFMKSVNSGMEIRREYSVERDGRWELISAGSGEGFVNKRESSIKTGDIVRVDIFLSLPTARNFPVVSDPVPGCFEPVNRDLATASVIDAEKAGSALPEGSWWFKFTDWYEFNESRWSFYHQELGHSAVRYYADYLPAGNYHLSYTAQVIAKGTFTAMPTHVEEMYNADIFGKGTADKISVAETPK